MRYTLRRRQPPILIERLQLEKGDILIVTCDLKITLAHAQEIKRQIKEVIPDIPVLVMGPNLKLGLLNTETTEIAA